MRQETNNEMDLLLRRLGRRHDGSVSTAEDHLDADELSAYSENVLPAAARARYSAHLADCLKCRELVVQLSSAAGAVVAHETAKVAPPSFFKKFLANLFSPMVLRYAVPALGLIVVGFIGFAVLRRERAADLMARVEQTPPAAAPVSPAPQNDKNYGFYDGQDKPSATANGRTNKQEEPTKSTAAEPPAPVSNSASAVAGAATPSPEDKSRKAEQSAAANEPPAKEAPKTAAAPGEQRQSVEVQARREPIDTPAATIQSSADRSYKAAEEREVKDLAANRDTRSAKRAPAPAPGGRGLATLGETDKVTADKDRKDDSAETRSVAGRRFRRERGIWIDTDYNSGSTTNVTRGSEYYRSLIADEPEIKNIADQLEGEIIVIWKGRTYRIK
jgi:hypothetical protein